MRFTTAVAALVASCSLSAAEPELPTVSEELPATVADPRYGVALFEYYQGNYWAGLSELMVAEARGGISGHGHRPAVMRGGFSLAYGMDRRAAQIFEQVLNDESDSAARDAAWFYLAQLRYTRGDWSGAEAAVTEISQQPPEKFREDLLALKVNLALRQGELDQAQLLLQNNEFSEQWLPYLYYNLAAAKSRRGDFAAAVDDYNRIPEMPLQTDEQLALYDRAMTAAGFSLLHEQKFAAAQSQFSRVRVDSPLSSSAMLGYGWAASEQEDFLDALTTWQRLAEYPLVDENAQEALLAVPYAYEQLGDRGRALRHFENAEQRFSAEIAMLGELLNNLDEATLAKALGIRQGGSFDWLDQSSDRVLEPKVVYLSDLFARNSFQGQVQELRDLMDIQSRLLDWRDKLGFYQALVDEREASRTQRLGPKQQQAIDQRLNELRSRRAQLQEVVTELESEQDYAALAQGEERQLWRRVQSAEASLAQLERAGVDVGEQAEQLRRYQGLLLWQASEDFAPRLWDIQKHLAELEQQLLDLAQTRDRVADAIANARDLAPYRERLTNSEKRVAQQLDQVERTIAQVQNNLHGQVAAVLQEQQQRLQSYLAQARVAVARLYDSARVGQP